ncbi:MULTISPECIES: ABC transporter ATP-binding protein [unclassified Blastococcus]
MVDQGQAAAPGRRRRGSARDLPGLLRAAARLTWTASPGRLLVLLAVQLFSSFSFYVQVLLIDQVLSAVLDIGRTGGSVGPAVLPVVLLGLFTAAMTIATALANLQQRMLGELVSREVWRRLLDVSQAVDLESYEDPDFYDQAQRAQTNAAQQTRLVVQGLLLVVGGSLGVVAGAVAVLTLAPSLLPLLLLSGVPLLLTSRTAGRHEFDFAVAQSARLRVRAYLQTVLTRREEAEEVRAFALPAALRRRWEAHSADYLAALGRHLRRRRRLALLGTTVSAVLTVGTLLLALLLVDRGLLDPASAGAALIAIRLLGTRVSGTVTGAGTVFESALFLRDLAAFLERLPARDRGRARPAAPDRFDRIVVSGVTFRYPRAARPALDGVTVELGEGEVVALVGENGSGKTTLAKLLAGLYEPEAGAVSWDGVDLRTLDPESVRRRIAVVFQDFVRYKLSARDNIGVGRVDEADEEAVRAAARQAGADGFLSALPAGYDTPLSKEYVGGTDLSLGQWQRVALARAFVRDAPLVILDEPAAALDARAEHELFERIRRLFAGRTVLVISHRLSTVRTADRIYVLSGGRVVEHGDHTSLMAAHGLYADLFELQARAYLDAGDAVPTAGQPPPDGDEAVTAGHSTPSPASRSGGRTP